MCLLNLIDISNTQRWVSATKKQLHSTQASENENNKTTEENIRSHEPQYVFSTLVTRSLLDTILLARNHKGELHISKCLTLSPE